MLQSIYPPVPEVTPLPRLLMVDDQPVNVMGMLQIFAGDYQMFIARDGVEALQVCRDNPPDLVLLDVLMPGLNGMEVCRRLKSDQQTRHIPVVFISSKYLGEDQLRETGAAGFIERPVTPAMLRQSLQSIIDPASMHTPKIRPPLHLVFGSPGRSDLNGYLTAEWGHCLLEEQPLVLLFINVDYLARFNDLYGYAAGDECLRRVEAAARSCLTRPYDVATSYGSANVVAVLPEADFRSAGAIAYRIEQAVKSLNIEHAGSDVAPVVTVSIGGAMALPACSGTQQDLIQRAEDSMRAAKQAGRGRILFNL